MAQKTTKGTLLETMEETDFHRLTPLKKDEHINGTIGFPNPDDGGKTKLMGKFKIYDGFAFGVTESDGFEREVFAQYPLTALINKNVVAKSLKESIKTRLHIEEDRDVTPLEIFISYGQFRFVDSI